MENRDWWQSSTDSHPRKTRRKSSKLISVDLYRFELVGVTARGGRRRKRNGSRQLVAREDDGVQIGVFSVNICDTAECAGEVDIFELQMDERI